MKKIISITLVYSLLLGQMAWASKCEIGLQECKDHGYSTTGKRDGANGYKNLEEGKYGDTAQGSCTMLGLSAKVCKDEATLATAYTAMAAVCMLGYVMQSSGYGAAAAQALRLACTYGSLATQLSELVMTKLLKDKVKDFKKLAEEDIVKRYGVVDSTLSNILVTGVMGAALATTTAMNSAGSSASSASEQSAGKTAMIILAIVNAGYAALKTSNKSKIMSNSESIKSNLEMLWAPKQNELSQNGYNQMLNGSVPADGATNASTPDSRGASGEVATPKEDVNLARIGESYAKEDLGKILGRPPSAGDINKAFDALSKVGITPAGLASAVSTKGPIGALSDIASKAGNENIAGLMRDMGNEFNKFPTDGPSFLASNATGGSAGKKSDGFDMSALLGGNRGPSDIGSGSAKGINFGGFDGDIWHTGSTLSIFEIVSKKTQDVSGRIGKN